MSPAAGGIGRSPSVSKGRRPVIDDELELREPVPVIDLGPEQRTNALRHRGRRAERHRLESLRAARERQLGMTLADAALADHVEDVVERRCRKPLAPYTFAQHGAELDRQLAVRDGAVAFNGPV